MGEDGGAWILRRCRHHRTDGMEGADIIERMRMEGHKFRGGKGAEGDVERGEVGWEGVGGSNDHGLGAGLVAELAMSWNPLNPVNPTSSPSIRTSCRRRRFDPASPSLDVITSVLSSSVYHLCATLQISSALFSSQPLFSSSSSLHHPRWLLSNLQIHSSIFLFRCPPPPLPPLQHTDPSSSSSSAATLHHPNYLQISSFSSFH